MPSETQPSGARRHRWPWLVALGLVLGIVLAVLWMKQEVERTRLRTQGFPSESASTTNAATGENSSGAPAQW
jgi:hypothetical protein